MYRPLSLSAALLVALAPAARGADDDPKEIIARAIKAHGGEEFLSKHKATQAKNKGKITIPGVGEVEFTQEASTMLPDKLKESLEMKVMGQNLSILTRINGDAALLEVNGKEMELPDAAKEALKDASYMIKAGRLFPLLKEKGYELSLIGEDKVEGKPVVGVRIAAKGHKDVSLYFDKKTNLLTKVESRARDPFTQNEITEERIVAEYAKNKDGIPVPKKVLVKHDGKTFLEAEVLEMTYLEKLDESEFKK